MTADGRRPCFAATAAVPGCWQHRCARQHPTTVQQDGGPSPSDGETPPPRRLNAWGRQVPRIRPGDLGVDGKMLL